MKRTLLIILLMTISFASFSQEKNLKRAATLISQNEKDKAINLLEKNIKDYPKYTNSYLFLAEIYYGDKNYRKSIEYYSKAIAISPNILNRKERERIDYLKKKIDFQDSLINHPVSFTPYHLNEGINTIEDEYLPCLTIDEQLYFTRRSDNKEDFFYCKKLDNSDTSSSTNTPPSWSNAVKLPYPLNTDENEGAASISPDGMYLYFAKCNAKDGLGSCDIYRSKHMGTTWSEPENLGETVNTSAWESQPSMASDGRTLFFVSNREGGYGKSDIYFTYLKDDSTWTKAKNCGAKINTPGMEISPFIHPSNSTLYFASDSLWGLGGMDIFYSKIENGKFQTPVNIGYGINTEKDENSLIVSADATYAIYAREDKNKKMDLYAFQLPNALRPQAVICMKGIINYDDNKNGNEAVLQIKNLTSGRIVTATISDRITNSYMLTLPTDEDYALSVTCEGYLFYGENFSLKNIPISRKSIIKNIFLQSIKEGSSIVLENIFFETNSSDLKKESNAELNTLKEFMNKNPLINVEISGHTDNVGMKEYNISLSQHRAESVKNWLIKQGIKENRIVCKGYGMQKPIADNTTEEGRAKNRRTEFKIWKNK